MRIPRSRGAVSGLLLVIMGLWGGLIPFVGPYFNFAIGRNHAWTWSTGRLWLDILPGAAAVIGGLMLMGSANRASGGLGAWIALAGGAWFVIGPVMSMLWNHGVPQTGIAHGGTGRRTLEELTYYYGLGAAIAAVSSFAMGRMSVLSVRDAEIAGRHHPVATGAAAGAGAEYARHRERKRERRFFRRGAGRDERVAEPVGGERTTAYDSTRDPRA
jgi:hypothetical protein